MVIAPCFYSETSCVIQPACALQGMFGDALEAFLSVLDGVTLADLASVPLVLTAQGTSVRAVVDSAFANAGCTPEITCEPTYMMTAIAMVRAGLGVTILPHNVVPRGLNAEVRRLKPPHVRELFAFTRQEWSPLAKSFLDVLQELRWHGRPHNATTIP